MVTKIIKTSNELMSTMTEKSSDLNDMDGKWHVLYD
jgi:hypothetical protein